MRIIILTERPESGPYANEPIPQVMRISDVDAAFLVGEGYACYSCDEKYQEIFNRPATIQEESYMHKYKTIKKRKKKGRTKRGSGSLLQPKRVSSK